MDINKITLKNVRLSFPSLFETETFGGEDTGKFAATFILDKDENADVIKVLKVGVEQLIKDEFKGQKIATDKICLKDGDELGRSEYVNAYIIKASTKKRPLVIDRDKTPLVAEDGKPYSGCYVNAVINLWAQNNQWGKRINSRLGGVQFFKDGEAFAGGGATTDDFDCFDNDDLF